MENNIFIKNKYNPDVLKKYNEKQTKRNCTKYENKNIPYKLIINDDTPKKIKSEKDLKIKINENNSNIKQSYEKIIKQREYDDNNNKISKEKDNINKGDNDINKRNNDVQLLGTKQNDYGDLKKSRIDYYKTQQKELNNEKERYSNIMNSLKSKGLII